MTNLIQKDREPVRSGTRADGHEVNKLLRRVRVLTCLFMLALVAAGVTAIPLPAEVDWLAGMTGANSPGEAAPSWAHWITRVQFALHETAARHSFLFYGTDWLAFGHFVIAIAFLGAVRDPVRNAWLFRLGIIACALVIPYALILGGYRGVPWSWRLIDCSFGVLGFIPMWLCHRWIFKLERAQKQ